jgi:hypothetical protein
MAAAAGAIDDQEKNDLLSKMRSLYFPQRSHRALMAMSPRFRDYFRTGPLPDIKRDDAIQLLHTMRDSRTFDAQRDSAEILSSL